MRRLLAVALALCAAASCQFRADLGRFPECAEDGSCALGQQCWAEQWRCVPLCGEQADCDAGTGRDEDGGQLDSGASDGGVVDAGPLRFDAGEPVRAVELVPYSWRFQALGGSPPYLFGLVDGGQPSGLSLAFEGTLSGTTAEVGRFEFSVRVNDDSSPIQTSTGTVTLRVAPQLRIGNKVAIADALADNAYNEQLYGTGGVPPYRWTLDAGTSLPGTLQLTTGGAMTGSTSAGSSSFVAVLTDSDTPPQVVRRELSLTARAAPLGPEFFTQQLADGRVGVQYDQQLRAAGGSPPLTFSHVGGELPPGLTFSGSLVSGIPTDAGTYSPEFQVRDAIVGTQNKTFSITIF